MKLRQLSLFLENRTGALCPPMQLLADAGVDLLTVSLADTARFGILRFIVRDPAHASRVLEEAGMVVNVSEVVPIEVADEPGGLAAVVSEIEKAGLGVEYMYLFGGGTKPGTAAIVFRFEEPDRAIETLLGAGVRVLRAEELLAAR